MGWYVRAGCWLVCSCWLLSLLGKRQGGNEDFDPTEEFSTKITQELNIMKENSHIDKNTFDYLKPDKPKVGRFYLLPKIHKVNNPGRPIVSANGHPTEKISEFVDFHLRLHVEALPSHLKDTK
jgi:hypothetical protein